MREDWDTRKLGDVCSFLNRGVSPKYTEKRGIVVLNQRCIRDHHVNFEVARRHDIKAKSVSSERLVQAGDVLVNSTGEGTLGRVAQSSAKNCLSQQQLILTLRLFGLCQECFTANSLAMCSGTSRRN